MQLKKLEKAVKLMKAQVDFMATQQKEQLDLNKKIIAYSRNVSKKADKSKNKFANFTKSYKKSSGSGYSFQVYSHLLKEMKRANN